MTALLTLMLVAASPPPPPQATPVGEEVWTKRCSGCHGDDGRGDTRVGHKYKIADFTDPSWGPQWTQDKVEATVREGVDKKMPAWKDRLTPDEIRAVSEYARTLGKPAGKAPPAK